MQGVWHMSWHCGYDVIYVDQEESGQYYTTLGNTLSKLNLSTDHPIQLHSCCSIEEEVTEPLVHFAKYTRLQKR